MRVALVGWEIDEAVAEALVGLGAEVVAITRGDGNTPPREDRDGWMLLRCPHQLGGDLAAGAGAFRDSVLTQVRESGLELSFDVVHAFEPLARPAAATLVDLSSRSAAVVSITPADQRGEPASSLPLRADRWVADHPWLAERWRDRTPGGTQVRPVVVERFGPERTEVPAVFTGAPGPIVTFWVPRDAVIDPVGLVAAIGLARGSAPGLTAVVLGTGAAAETLRHRLAGRGWLARSQMDADGEMTLDRWQSSVACASVVGVPAESPAQDPTARIAWGLGVPVVRIDRPARDGSDLAGAIGDRLFNPSLRDREVRAGAILARRAREPVHVALGWLRVYLDALTSLRARRDPDPAREAPPWLLPGVRSRLSLVAISPRALHASWLVRPDDWTTALEWLGADATRAVLTIRLLDITDLLFDGEHGHAQWDIDVGFGESSRTLPLAFPGRSLAARLGVRSPRGVFLPLALARLCHLPREGLAPTEPVRRLRALPRRRSG
jgi:hypothetical protein